MLVGKDFDVNRSGVITGADMLAVMNRLGRTLHNHSLRLVPTRASVTAEGSGEPAPTATEMSKLRTPEWSLIGVLMKCRHHRHATP